MDVFCLQEPSLQQLATGPHEEDRVGRKVALEQATRFPIQPVKPFQTDSLDISGSLRNGTGMEIKGGADTEHDTFYLRAMLHHPLLLLGTADTYPDEMRFSRVQAPGVFLVLFVCQFAERRADGFNNFQPWKLFL